MSRLVSVLAAVDNLFRFLGQRLTEAPDSLLVGDRMQKIACSAGCSFCCHLEVGLGVPELVRLSVHIREMETDARTALRQRVKAAVRAIGARRGKARKKARIMCPLLTAQGTCGVYEARPLACRTHVSADREACRRDWAAPGAGVKTPQSALLIDMGASLRAQIARHAERLGLQGGTYELVRALDMALDDDRFPERVAEGEVRLDDRLLVVQPQGVRP